MQSLNLISKDRTVILIAHRLSTLENCDRIIRLEEVRLSSMETFMNFVKKMQNWRIPNF